MKKCFGFSFSFDDGKDLTMIIPVEQNEFTYTQEEKMFTSSNEKKLESIYGIHDICGGEIFQVEHKGVYVEYENIFGFMTYEVSREQVDTLMCIWKDILTDELCIKTGPIIKVN